MVIATYGPDGSIGGMFPVVEPYVNKNYGSNGNISVDPDTKINLTTLTNGDAYKKILGSVSDTSVIISVNNSNIQVPKDTFTKPMTFDKSGSSFMYVLGFAWRKWFHHQNSMPML